MAVFIRKRPERARMTGVPMAAPLAPLHRENIPTANGAGSGVSRSAPVTSLGGRLPAGGRRPLSFCWVHQSEGGLTGSLPRVTFTPVNSASTGVVNLRPLTSSCRMNVGGSMWTKRLYSPLSGTFQLRA